MSCMPRSKYCISQATQRLVGERSDKAIDIGVAIAAINSADASLNTGL
jgi:hypothetical protein